MVKFNIVQISADNKKLTLDIELIAPVDGESISKISIDTQDTYINTGPSNSAKVVYESSTQVSSVRLELEGKEYEDILNNNLLFIYVQNLPANFYLAVTLNAAIVYAKLMHHIKELECCCNCNIPKGFIDYFLRFKGLEACVNTGNYVQACRIFTKYIKPVTNKWSTLNCRCNE